MRTFLYPAAGALALLAAAAAFAQPPLSRAEQEQFLLTARILHRRPVSKGVTLSWRVTLSDGRTTHDAHVQTVNEQRTELRTDTTVELNFRDTYKFNIAAYRLDRLLGLGMVPTSVERSFEGQTAAFTWWVDDVLGDEHDRMKGKFEPPDVPAYNEQAYAEFVFINLIYNTDPNRGNFLTDRNFDVWMIDFTRAFRRQKKLRDAAVLKKCDRKLLAGLRALDPAAVNQQLSRYVLKPEIAGLLARRDLIVKHFDELIAAQGEAAVLYDMRRVAAR
jgi:hypothetical protein